MVQKICSILLAVALSLSVFATPVRADDDFKKFLTALAVMGVIGVVADRQRDNTPVVQPKPKPKPKPKKPKTPDYWGNYDKQLPKKCFKKFDTSEGKAAYFDNSCLKKSYRLAGSLPKQCERTVWTDSGKRKLFSPNCLNHNGYYTLRRDY